MSGLATAGVQIRLTAIAYNMKRSLKVIATPGQRARPLPALTQEPKATANHVGGYCSPIALKPGEIKQINAKTAPAHRSL